VVVYNQNANCHKFVSSSAGRAENRSSEYLDVPFLHEIV
jgi:hypothetical protein